MNEATAMHLGGGAYATICSEQGVFTELILSGNTHVLSETDRKVFLSPEATEKLLAFLKNPAMGTKA